MMSSSSMVASACRRKSSVHSIQTMLPMSCRSRRLLRSTTSMGHCHVPILDSCGSRPSLPLPQQRKHHATASTTFIPALSSVISSRKCTWLKPTTPEIYRHHTQRYFSQHNLPHDIIHRHQQKKNRYERFRSCLLMSTSESLDTSSSVPIVSHSLKKKRNLMEVGKSTMEVLSSNRSAFHRTWNRMNPLIELVMLAACTDNDGDSFGNDSDTMKMSSNIEPKKRKMTTIADVGCDHGILSLSLACMAWVASNQNDHNNKENQNAGESSHSFFSRVIGTDVSSQALENGGLVSLTKIQASMPMIYNDDGGGGEDDDVSGNTLGSHSLPITFRLGDGLKPLQQGEADAVALAGMGVHSMIEILFGDAVEVEDPCSSIAPVDRVQTQTIFLQPTNSRPQHMIMLYDRLHGAEWVLIDERVAFVGGRWYINSFFERRRCNENELESTPFRFPGHYLRNDDNFDAYVKHHIQWLKEDYERPQGVGLHEEDRRWIAYLLSEEESGKWRSLASWFIQ